MLSDPLTLYKLMLLYMLKQVKFPLTGSQISDFFLGKEYTNYFTLQQAFSELTDAHLIKQETVRNSSRYEITSEGEETLVFFGSSISDAIKADIDAFLRENKVRLRNEVGIEADYYKSSTSDIIVQCVAREGKSILIKLEISVPDAAQAEIMCDNWKSSNQKIYAFVMQELLKGNP